MIVQNKILLKASLDYSQNDLGSNDILMKKINVLVWTNGVSWTNHDDWQYRVHEGWASFEKLLHLVGSNGNLMNKIKKWTSSRGGATMQTSPCRVFRIPTPCFLIWHSPDRVHGGWIRDVNKANSVCRQNIIFPSDLHVIPCMIGHHLIGVWKEKGNQKKNKNEHPAGVAPPCRPPPAGCSKFPSCAF